MADLTAFIRDDETGEMLSQDKSECGRHLTCASGRSGIAGPPEWLNKQHDPSNLSNLSYNMLQPLLWKLPSTAEHKK